MKKVSVIPGVWWVEVPEANLRLLCGSPMDVVKHLSARGFIHAEKKDGVSFESGPNAILLSEWPIQKGYLWNLVEFPVMHMLYNQGMIIPNHPNNDGSRPVIIGFEQQISSVLKYIHRGVYGLLSEQEMRYWGIADNQIEDLWNIKLKFAGGKISEIKQLVDAIPFQDKHAALPGPVDIYHQGANQFRIEFMGDTTRIDLRPAGKEPWRPAYSVESLRNRSGNFSVTHIGEGSGWNHHRPCMGSLICYEGKRYLVDCGPGVEYSIKQLAIAVNEIDGIFLTHAHDDHISGLTSLITGDRKIDIYAVPPIMATIRFKLLAVMERSEPFLNGLANIKTLEENSWTSVGGLEVKPVYSPHPIETSMFFFRVQAADGYKVYAHLADIISKNILDSFVDNGVVTSRYRDRLFGEYCHYAELKKIDAGGGLIHGSSFDFLDDPSAKLLSSHINNESGQEKFPVADFGEVDILIPSHRDEHLDVANRELAKMFPELNSTEISELYSDKVNFIPAGESLYHKGFLPDRMLLIVGGTVSSTFVSFTRGAIIGEEGFLFQDGLTPMLKSETGLYFVSVNPDHYITALKKEGLWERRLHTLQKRNFLVSGSFPGRRICVPYLDNVAENMKEKKWTSQETNEDLKNIRDELHIILQGSLEIISNRENYVLESGSIVIFGQVLPGSKDLDVNYTRNSLSQTVFFPGSFIRSYPSLLWALNESV